VFVPFKSSECETVISYVQGGDNKSTEKTYTVPSDGTLNIIGMLIPAAYTICKVNDIQQNIHTTSNTYCRLQGTISVKKDDVVYIKYGNGTTTGSTCCCVSAYFIAD